MSLCVKEGDDECDDDSPKQWFGFLFLIGNHHSNDDDDVDEDDASIAFGTLAHFRNRSLRTAVVRIRTVRSVPTGLYCTVYIQEKLYVGRATQTFSHTMQ
jgi:hypothetical protein